MNSASSQATAAIAPRPGRAPLRGAGTSASLAVLLLAAALGAAPAGPSTERFVTPGGTGAGTADAPFGRIQEAIDAAAPGDVIIVAPGTYSESLRTVRDGSADAPIVLRARDGRGTVTVTAAGRVLTVSHAYLTVEGLVLDGQYGPADLVRVSSSGTGFTLRDSEVRRTSRDAIDLDAPRDVLIEGSLVHHALFWDGGRRDAHGIVAGAVHRLTIRNTEVHTFSGDAVQVDPGRSPAGWTDVTIEGCRFWLAPLSESTNGFPAGAVPGENAVDTKASAAAPRARLRIVNTDAHGFRRGRIRNMAAFNLKEHIDAVVDRVTVFDSEIAFRMRGPGPNGGARVQVTNAVIHSTSVAFRYESNIETPRLYNITLGRGVARPFRAVSAEATTLDVRNLLLLGRRLPREVGPESNLAVPPEAFADVAQHDYRLAPGSPAIDAGVSIDEVTHDRAGTARPQGRGYDIGAYEHRKP